MKTLHDMLIQDYMTLTDTMPDEIAGATDDEMYTEIKSILIDRIKSLKNKE